MWQNLASYLIVAAAAVWVAWSVLLPRAWRERVRTRLSGAPRDGDTDCGCGRDNA
ncbi:MAG: hypothetical protein HY060_19635 [Proteobacteria bacterium]|nr:hypothetical protein [Pseudomonadota bacterium]